MSRVSVDGRIESLPVDTQEALRDIVRALNDIRVRVQRGTGTPEGNVVGYPGYIWQRDDGGAGTATYIFEGTAGSTTGWVAL